MLDFLVFSFVLSYPPQKIGHSVQVKDLPVLGPPHGLSLLAEVTASHHDAVLADETVLVAGAPGLRAER